MVGGIDAEWVIRGEAVPAVEVVGDSVYCDRRRSSARVADGARFFDGWQVTALGAEVDRLWVGSRGDADGDLLVGSLAAREIIYDGATTELVPWNPRVYADASADEHTTTGWVAHGAFAYQGDGYSVAASVDRALPGFRAIDARGRASDGRLVVGIGHRSRDGRRPCRSTTRCVCRIPSRRTLGQSIEQGLTFRGSFGPQVSLGVNYTAEDTSLARPGYERSSSRTTWGSTTRCSKTR